MSGIDCGCIRWARDVDTSEFGDQVTLFGGLAGRERLALLVSQKRLCCAGTRVCVGVAFESARRGCSRGLWGTLGGFLASPSTGPSPKLKENESPRIHRQPGGRRSVKTENVSGGSASETARAHSIYGWPIRLSTLTRLPVRRPGPGNEVNQPTGSRTITAIGLEPRA